MSIDLTANTLKFDKRIKDTQSNVENFAKVAKTAIITYVVNKGIDIATNAIKSFSSSVISVGSNFEKSMSKVAAITGATGNDLALLEQTARDFGSSTVFSASEAADALKYMALAHSKTSGGGDHTSDCWRPTE